MEARAEGDWEGADWAMAAAGKVEGGWGAADSAAVATARAGVEATATGGWGWEAAGCRQGGIRGGASIT